MRREKKLVFTFIYCLQTKGEEELNPLLYKLEKLRTEFEGAADVIMQLHTNFVMGDQLK